MITQQTAFEYAEALNEFIQAGGRIEMICACQDTKQVVRKSYSLMPMTSQVITEEQIDAGIASMEKSMKELEEQKEIIVAEREKIVAEEVL